MSHIKKFLFDTNNFDDPDDGKNKDILDDILEDLPPPPPTFSEEELEGARASAHAQGVREGVAQERARREETIAGLLSTMAEQFSALFAAERYRDRQFEEEAVRLALAVLDHACPPLRERLALEILEKSVKETIASASNKKGIRVLLNDQFKSEIEDLFSKLWQGADDAPRVKFISTPSMAGDDIAIEWEDGGIVRSSSAIAADIKTSLADLLDSAPYHGKKNNDIKEIE